MKKRGVCLGYRCEKGRRRETSARKIGRLEGKTLVVSSDSAFCPGGIRPFDKKDKLEQERPEAALKGPGITKKFWSVEAESARREEISFARRPPREGKSTKKRRRPSKKSVSVTLDAEEERAAMSTQENNLWQRDLTEGPQESSKFQGVKRKGVWTAPLQAPSSRKRREREARQAQAKNVRAAGEYESRECGSSMRD